MINTWASRPVVLGAVLFSFATAACASGGGRGRAKPDATPPVDGVAVPRDPAAAWIVRRTGAPVEQTIHIAAVLESRYDTVSAPRIDTVQSQLTVTWSEPSMGYPRRFLGSVTDYRVGGVVGDTLSRLPEIALPFSFNARQPVPSSIPEFITPGADCGVSPGMVVPVVRELWLSMPDTLRPGREWADSGTYTVCRDSIPLTVRVTRLFRVVDGTWRDSAVVVRVERRSTTRLDGSGRQFGEPVRITGEGTGTMMYEVDVQSGVAAFASGDAELHLTLISRRRTQQLTQRSRISLLHR